MCRVLCALISFDISIIIYLYLFDTRKHSRCEAPETTGKPQDGPFQQGNPLARNGPFGSAWDLWDPDSDFGFQWEYPHSWIVYFIAHPKKMDSDWGQPCDLGNLHLVTPSISMVFIKLRHLQSCFSEPSAARQAVLNPPAGATLLRFMGIHTRTTLPIFQYTVYSRFLVYLCFVKAPQKLMSIYAHAPPHAMSRPLQLHLSYLLAWTSWPRPVIHQLDLQLASGNPTVVSMMFPAFRIPFEGFPPATGP